MSRFACLLLLVFALGCNTAPAPEPEAEAPVAEAPAAEPKRFALHGKVLELRPGDADAAVIEHDEIVGFMDAMTMTFPVKDEAEFDKLHVNDMITADVVSNDDEFFIENIVVEAATAPAAQ